MEFSLKNSLIRPFKGNKFIEKFLIGGGFYLAALAIHAVNVFTNCMNLPTPTSGNFQENLMMSFKTGLLCSFNSPSGLIFHFINFLLLAIPLGYVAYYIHNYLHNKENILPDWKNNIFSFLKKGLSMYLISFYYLVLMLIAIIITVTVFSTIYYTLYYLSGVGTKQGGAFISGLIGMFISLIFTAVFPYVMCVYSESFKITNGLNFINVFRLVFKEFGKFMLCVIVCGFLWLVYYIIDLIMRMIIIGAPIMSFTIVPVCLMLLSPLVSVYILAKGRGNVAINEAESQPDAFDFSRTL